MFASSLPEGQAFPSMQGFVFLSLGILSKGGRGEGAKRTGAATAPVGFVPTERPAGRPAKRAIGGKSVLPAPVVGRCL
jgi:hypothetical protein